MKWIGPTTMALTILVAGVFAQENTSPPTFQDDLAFLRQHVGVIVLSDKSGNRKVVVIPEYQCRVMTSTAAGDAGLSYGWVNRELIASGKKQPHINVYGGEDRFWIGPEGGQYSIFFKKGDPFDLDHWFTPADIDTEPYEVVSKGDDHVTCRREIHLTNYSGTTFDLEVNRDIRVLDMKDVEKYFRVRPKAGVRMVAFESVNTIKNTGTRAWRKQSGLLSIWILGMLNASPATTVAIPFQKGPESKLGHVVNDAYFGKVPADRLVIKDGILYFAADAKYRSKIGIPPRRTKPVLGSYDATNHVLTLVQFSFKQGVTDYINSMWEIQKNPYGGDVVNSYNDGPPKPGAAQLGKFYELENSSPALGLAPNRSATHVSRMVHLQGPEGELDAIARAVLGVGLNEIENGLKK
jgi:hypothetical protein